MGESKVEGMTVFSPIKAGPEMIAMEGVDRVKYEEFQKELEPSEEHIAIPEI